MRHVESRRGEAAHLIGARSFGQHDELRPRGFGELLQAIDECSADPRVFRGIGRNFENQADPLESGLAAGGDGLDGAKRFSGEIAGRIVRCESSKLIWIAPEALGFDEDGVAFRTDRILPARKAS